MVEQHRCKDALSILDYLQLSFPASSYVLSQTAVAHYHLRSECRLSDVYVGTVVVVVRGGGVE